jgi:hypothetical protein
MSTTPDTKTATRTTRPSAGRPGRAQGLRDLAVTGVLAVVATVTVTAVAAALARAAGVDFAVQDGAETIPVSGVAFMTAVFCTVGLVLAAGFRRWSMRPADHFVRTAAALTAVSLVPPFVAGADAATVGTLIGLHVVAAMVMVPLTARALRVHTVR